MRSLGKGLQVLGLIVLPLAMLMQLSDLLGRRLELNQMVWMLVFGMLAFSLGRFIEGYAR